MGVPKAHFVHRSRGGDQQEASTRDIPRTFITRQRTVRQTLKNGRVEGNLWQTWTKSKSREDGQRKKYIDIKISRYKTGWEETDPTRQLWVERLAGTVAWRRKFTGEYQLTSCVAPAYLYGLEKNNKRNCKFARINL